MALLAVLPDPLSARRQAPADCERNDGDKCKEWESYGKRTARRLDRQNGRLQNARCRIDELQNSTTQRADYFLQTAVDIHRGCKGYLKDTGEDVSDYTYTTAAGGTSNSHLVTRDGDFKCIPYSHFYDAAGTSYNPSLQRISIERGGAYHAVTTGADPEKYHLMVGTGDTRMNLLPGTRVYHFDSRATGLVIKFIQDGRLEEYELTLNQDGSVTGDSSEARQWVADASPEELEAIKAAAQGIVALF